MLQILLGRKVHYVSVFKLRGELRSALVKPHTAMWGIVAPNMACKQYPQLQPNR